MGSHDDINTVQRPRYFEGMLLTAHDFQAEQEYHRNKLRMHYRCFHGCRVACGLEINLKRKSVHINPGMAIDCNGNEIVLFEPVKISLPSKKRRFFLTISYSEFETNPVLAPSSDCDLKSKTEGFSRIQESFKIDWSMKDPLSGHDWHDGAWVTCGRSHPIAIAKFIHEDGRIILDKSFKEKISAGRHNW